MTNSAVLIARSIDVRWRSFAVNMSRWNNRKIARDCRPPIRHSTNRRDTNPIARDLFRYCPNLELTIGVSSTKAMQ